MSSCQLMIPGVRSSLESGFGTGAGGGGRGSKAPEKGVERDTNVQAEVCSPRPPWRGCCSLPACSEETLSQGWGPLAPGRGAGVGLTCENHAGGLNMG